MDLPFLMLVLLLLGIGLIMMFSASYATAYCLVRPQRPDHRRRRHGRRAVRLPDL